MKNDGELKRKVISLIITTIVLTIGLFKNEILINNQKYTNSNNIIATKSSNEYDLEEDIVSFINENNEIFNFYTEMFGISLNDLKKSIIMDNQNNKFNKLDIGNANKEYNSLDKNLIDYLFKLKKSNQALFKQEYKSGTEYKKEYIYSLINYYSKIYDNVDYNVLLSIAYIESGNLNSKYMLKRNNIFGGMSSKGLIKYNNIEFGVLSYVKIMSEKYYAKGLNTIDKIAKKYNPTSTTWVNKVKKVSNKFNNNKEINIYKLINLK